MIWALVILAVVGNLTAAFAMWLAHIERSRLVAAMLQSNFKGDAARRLAPLSKSQTEAAVAAQREIQENDAAPFSASNPFGNAPAGSRQVGI